jgi:glycosyltransferase involved in cell wall biosynthesis
MNIQRILELNFEKNWRGGERQTLYNMIGFRNEGIEVELICRKGSILATKATQHGFRIHPFKTVFGVIGFLIRKGSSFDIHHSQTSHILTYCVFTKSFHGVKSLFTRRINFTPKGFFTALKYRFTDGLIGVSISVQQTIINFTGRKDVRMISDIFISKELNKERAQQTIKELGIEGKHIIATTTALTFEKDPLTMVEAIRELKKMRNDIVFLHFGRGDLTEQAQQKIDEYGLQQTYFLMGYTENVEDFFSVMEVFTMSSADEGLGSSVLDAFVYKVPVASTNAGGLKDIMQDERGVVCEIKNPVMLAKGIDILLNDKVKRQQVIDNAFEYVNRYHGLKYITDQYIEQIKITLENK